MFHININTTGIVGNIFSSPIFESFGYYGVYGINTSLITLALLYTIFMVHNYPLGYKGQVKPNIRENADGETSWFQSKVFHPLKDLFGTLLRQRPNNMRTLLLVNFFAMAMYYATVEVIKITQLHSYRIIILPLLAIPYSGPRPTVSIHDLRI